MEETKEVKKFWEVIQKGLDNIIDRFEEAYGSKKCDRCGGLKAKKRELIDDDGLGKGHIYLCDHCYKILNK